MIENEIYLIEQAKIGDGNAFTQLVKYYSPKIYNLSLRMMQNKADAEDVLQEAFLIMMQKLHTFEGRSSLYTWLYRVATNVALEKLKNKHRVNITASIDDPNYEKMGNVEPYEIPNFDEKELTNEQFKYHLGKGMEKLNENLKAVFILRDIEGHSVKETAEILDISESNVKVRLMRARLSLRDELSEKFKKEGWV
jgi:RNA polymerase sigma-70 factor, ECF subfamily